MADKEIYNELSVWDKKLNIGLSLFVIAACAVGLFMVAGNETGMTGFSVFEKTELGSLDMGAVFFIALLAMIIVALVNLAYSLGKK